MHSAYPQAIKLNVLRNRSTSSAFAPSTQRMAVDAVIALESMEREVADLSRVWEPPPRCRDARKYDWAAGPGDRGALRDRHIA